jgi:hypothetical protein
LDVLPNTLKRHWRQFMLEKLTLNSLTTALVDIPAVSLPIARSLKVDICGIVLCDTLCVTHCVNTFVPNILEK